MDTRPIGIFDSGVGGLTVFSKIVKTLEFENIIYLGDTKQFPYGSRSKQTIIELSKKNIEFLISKGVKAVVIACGTATSQALEELKDKYNIPIMGIIEPTALGIAKETNVKKIGVIATTGTIRSGAWEKKLKENIENIEVLNKACPLLAQVAEEGWIDNEIAELIIKEYMKELKESEIEKLILGCTHYPLFKNLLKKEFGDNVEIVDTGEKVGIALKELLKEKGIENLDEKSPEYKFYLTDTEDEFVNVANKFLDMKVEIEKVVID